MTSTQNTPQPQPGQQRQSVARILAGPALLLPAVVCGLTELLIPTLRTFWLSLQRVDLTGGIEFVGLENYTYLIGQPAFGQALGFTLFSLLVRLILVGTVPPALAWAVGRLGRAARLGARMVLTVPIVLFAPVAIALTWSLLLRSGAGPFHPGLNVYASPGGARTALILIDSLYLLGLACGLGLIFYLPIWRRPEGSGSPAFHETWRPLLATWGVGILATVGLSLSTFSLAYALTGGGPADSTSTLGIHLFKTGFAYLKMGSAAGLATLILLITLALGLVAGLLIVLARLRLTTVDTLSAPAHRGQPATHRWSQGLPAVVLALTLLLTVGACFLGSLAFAWIFPKALGEGAFGQLMDQLPLGRLLVNSAVPPFLAATLQLLVAYPAALSLGALKPLGKHSDWLLLAFSPWLFVTVLPLSVVSFLTARNIGALDSFVGLISPLLFSVPALFVLTLFFSGQAQGWRTATADGGQSGANDFLRRLILPSLPLSGFLLLLLFILGWQEYFWPFVASIGPERMTLSVALVRLVQATAGLRPGLLAAGVSLLVAPMGLLLFVALVLFQFLYLDRLVLYAKRRQGKDF